MPVLTVSLVFIRLRHEGNHQLLSPRLWACNESKRNTSALYDYDILIPLIPTVPLRTLRPIRLVYSTMPVSVSRVIGLFIQSFPTDS